MSLNTPLVRPSQSQVKIEPTAKSAASDGFAYPTIRLLNKLARPTISKPYQLSKATHYHILAVANSKGWFAAARFNGSSYELALSSLEDLRSATKLAKAGSDDVLTCKRIISLTQSKPNILTFADRDSRLIVALEQGSVLVYDTAALFTPGEDQIQPTHTRQLQASPLRQIASNPGSEANLVDRVAIVGDGVVQLFNMQLEPQGGWSGSDASTPAAVAWSPKGKHIAIGLKTGDILTFALTNMTTPHKHIPPTFDGSLVSLSWTGPGHTFRTSYAKPQEPSDPALHIVSLDVKTNTGIYYSLLHPFVSGDRSFQSPYLLQLPKWDEDSSSDSAKSLFVFGDSTSVDLEILAQGGSAWYQQSQESPVSLPLNKDMDDTMLLSLDLDLTETSTATPVFYAYLNDGTLQAWYLEHSKPYALMVSAAVRLQVEAPEAIQADTSMSTEQDQSTKPAASPFGQPSSAFGQSSFGGTSAFGPLSAFGKPSAMGSTGFSAFSSTAPAPFGQAVTTQSNSASVFGSTSSTNAFSSSSTSPFGSFGGSAPAFGQPGFGNNATTSTFGSAALTSDMTREASMADDTPGFGGLSLGSSNADGVGSNPSGGIFGSLNNGASNTQTGPRSFGGGDASSSSGSAIKPATGFSAFGPSATSAFSNPPTSTTPTFSTFGQTSQPAAALAPASSTADSAFGKPGFGHSSFGQTSLGKPAFGQPAFGQSGFGSTPAATTATTAGGFGSFANKPASFTGGPQSSAAGGTSGGFSAFAGKPTSLASAPQTIGGSVAAFGGGGGFSAFAGNATGLGSALKTASSDAAPPTETPLTTSTSPFGSTGSVSQPIASVSAFGGSSGSTPSVFGNTSTNPPTSVFGSPFTLTPSEGKVPAPAGPVKPPGISSPPSSPEPSPADKPTSTASNAKSPAASAFKSSQPPVTTGAFGNLQTSPSAFRPASGFGAFGATSSPSEASPFFKKPEQKAPVSVFATLSSSVSGGSPSSSTLPGKQATTPTFGSPSLLGAQKSLFPPPTPPSPTPAKTSSAGGFSAFSGPPATLAAFSAPSSSGSSFASLLKTGDGFEDPAKASGKPSEKVSIFGIQEKKAEKPLSPEALGTDASFGDISSAGSSFVDVKSETKARGDEEEQSEHETRSIHSEDYGSDGSYEPGASDEDEDDDDLSDDHLDDEEDDSREGEGEEEGGSGEEGEEEGPRSPSPEPVAVPLPPSRSASATPQPEVPNIKVTQSTERSGSATPPGTPESETKAGPRKSPSPSPTSTSPTPPPLGIGLGRPSTRPTRSSPLASAPLSGNNEEEDSKGAATTPKLAAAVPPKKGKDENSEPISASLSTSKTLPMPNTPVLAHAKPPARPATAPLVSGGEKATPAIPPLFGSTPAFGQQPIFGQAKTPATPSNTPPSPGFFNNTTPSASSSLPVPFDLSRPTSQPPASSSFFGSPPTPPKSSAYKGSVSPNFFNSPPTQPTSTVPFNLPSFNLGGAASSKAPASSVFGAPAPAPPTFGSGSTPSFFGTPPPAPAGSSIFGGPPPVPSTFGAIAPPAFGNQNFKLTPPVGNPFGTVPPPPLPAGGFNIAPKGTGSTTPPAPVSAPAPPPPPELSMEDGMQKECALLIINLNRELEELRLRAQQVSQKRQHLGKSAGGSWNSTDLGDSAKWSLGDLKQFGQVLAKFGDDLTALKEQREKAKQEIRDLNSSMLKAGTRREEIARFNKAKTDPEFAKMLRTRTLGPEHSETQTQLRRGIRTMRDRISKLEAILQSSKKKLAESMSGKPSIKAPTLDTVNRTFRNIEIALDQQTTEVSKLTSRFSTLNVDAASLPSTPTRDARLPDRTQRRPYNVTPNVAATTAAALNAERGAHKLKKALLAVRKEPLLNVNVNASKPPPVAFGKPEPESTPKRPAVVGGGFTPATPFSLLPPSGGLFTPPNPSELSDPRFSFSNDDDFSPSALPPAGPSNSRKDRSSTKKHSSVQLPKKSPGIPSAPVPSFDWGPIPTYNTSPSNLFANFPKRS